MREGELESPPSFASRAARRAFADRAAESKPSLLRRILATLAVDGPGLTPAYGLRSGQSGERTMLFTAEEHDVQVTVRQSDGTWWFAGQVLGPDAEGEVALTGSGTALRSGLNDMCEFAFPPVPAGTYSLSLRLAEAEIVLPDIALE
jgi:hypothetical protein